MKNCRVGFPGTRIVTRSDCQIHSSLLVTAILSASSFFQTAAPAGLSCLSQNTVSPASASQSIMNRCSCFTLERFKATFTRTALSPAFFKIQTYRIFPCLFMPTISSGHSTAFLFLVIAPILSPVSIIDISQSVRCSPSSSSLRMLRFFFITGI